jgi:DNA-binding MarR family transcriptional regulator
MHDTRPLFAGARTHVDAQPKSSPAPSQAKKASRLSGAEMLSAGERFRAGERDFRAVAAQYDRRFGASSRLYVETILRAYPRRFDFRPVKETARLLGLKRETVYAIWDKLEGEELIAVDRNAWGRGRHLVWPLPRSGKTELPRTEEDKQADFKSWVARFLVCQHEDVALRTLMYLRQEAYDGEAARSFSEITEALKLTDRANAARAVRLIIGRGWLRKTGRKADSTRIYRLMNSGRVGTKPVDANGDEPLIIDQNGMPVETEPGAPFAFAEAYEPSHDQIVELYRQQTAQRQAQAINRRRRRWTSHATS